MSLTPVYRDVWLSLEAARQGSPLWAAFQTIAYRPHQSYFDGLTETYGPDLFGPSGLPGAVERSASLLHQALSPSAAYHMEERAESILEAVRPHLPGRMPDLYLGTLFFIAPAATLSVRGRPVIAIGMERFSPTPPSSGEKFWYHPDEIVEMLPHEAAHAVRMEALSLPPTPRALSLLEMILLEGTALLFTDLLLGKETLSTFMNPDRLAWHKANDTQVIGAAARDFPLVGMEAFGRYFAVDSPVSGYYIGLSLCRRYVDRYGTDSMPELLVTPSAEVLRRLS